MLLYSRAHKAKEMAPINAVEWDKIVHDGVCCYVAEWGTRQNADQ